MKKYLKALAALALLLATPAKAADSTVAAMTAASALGGTELLYTVQGGADRKATPLQMAAYIYGLMSGDATASGTGAVTLATVNSNVGTFGSSTNCVTLTVNAKGLITAASQTACAGGGGGSPGGSTTQLQWNNAGSFAGMAGTTWDDTNRSLVLTGATVTASKPIFDLSQTWNNAGVAFTALKLNTTNTASASGSLLLDLQVAGSSKFNVDKNGGVVTPSALTIGATSFIQFGARTYIDTPADAQLRINNNAGTQQSTLTIPTSGTFQFGQADAASPVAQTIQAQSVVAGTSNTGGQPFTIKGSAGTGNVVGGSIIFQVAPLGSSGTSQNAYTTAFTVNGNVTTSFAAAMNVAGIVTASAFNAGTTGYYQFGAQGLLDSPGTGQFRFSNSAQTQGFTLTGGLTAYATPQMQIGAPDAAAPIAQQVQVQSVVAGTSNTAGTDWIFQGSKGTGIGAGGSLVFKTSPAGSTGSTQNAGVTAMTINSAGAMTLPLISGSTQCLNVNSSGVISGTGSTCGAGGGGVTSLTPGGGLVSSVTAGCTQTAITSTGTVSQAECVNAQTGTTYTVLDTDRAKLVTYSNASSIAVTLPQAGASSAFVSGWVADFVNKGVGTVTVTPTTSTINGAATLVLTTGQSARIVSDGTNYQVISPTSAPLTVSTSVQAGTNYAFVSTDQAKVVYLNNATAQTPTIAQATGSFGAGWFTTACNIGAGIQTLTPTTSTIGGASTLAIPAGSAAAPTCATIISDGTNYLLVPSANTYRVSNGTSALGTSAIGSAACATTVTTSAPGVATTDVINWGFNGDPTAVTGYVPLTAGMLTIIAYPSANNVNFKVCNNTSTSITPGAITLNWKIVR